MSRGFKVVKDEFRKHKGIDIRLPKRSTKNSAGYDIFLPCDLTLEPNEKKMIFTDVKAYMKDDEVLLGYIRSSLGVNGIVLSNGTSVIDSDYYGNQNNDGNIGLPLWNTSDKRVEFKRGDRIGQLVFTKYFVADNDNAIGDRNGGFGHTGK